MEVTTAQDTILEIELAHRAILGRCLQVVDECSPRDVASKLVGGILERSQRIDAIGRVVAAETGRDRRPASSARWLHPGWCRELEFLGDVPGPLDGQELVVEFCAARGSLPGGAQGHNSPPPEHVSRRLQFVDSGAEPLEFDAATLRLPTSSLQVTTPPIVDFATECCRRGINDGPGYYPDDLNCAQGHNSPPPEHVSRRLQFVDSGAEPLEFDAATLRLPTSSLQVTTPPIVDFATECCRRGINDGPGYYPDDLNLTTYASFFQYWVASTKRAAELERPIFLMMASALARRRLSLCTGWMSRSRSEAKLTWADKVRSGSSSSGDNTNGARPEPLPSTPFRGGVTESPRNLTFQAYSVTKPTLCPDFQRASGIATLVRKDITFVEKTTLAYKQGLESQLVEIIAGRDIKANIFILSVYSLPRDRLRNFNSLFLVAKTQAKNKPLMIAGD
ncbi:hypothetical protein HPB51_028524 [Rhipicephalus microplus]|uniref:Uncharacterized protein n=1 Tax=Rhipicephalus microplus TaxID=6941 RepID=A0A9J6CX51_RHIMP|nr:hypothetical protein HPB51_028524 [Rhipicephalus microplus]